MFLAQFSNFSYFQLDFRYLKMQKMLKNAGNERELCEIQA